VASVLEWAENASEVVDFAFTVDHLSRDELLG
jgi:hypothetical protein